MMLLLIPLFPFLGFLVNASIGRRLSKGAAGLVAVAAMVASFAVALTSVIQLTGLPEESRALTQTVFTWMSSGNFTAGTVTATGFSGSDEPERGTSCAGAASLTGVEIEDASIGAD